MRKKRPWVKGSLEAPWLERSAGGAATRRLSATLYPPKYGGDAAEPGCRKNVSDRTDSRARSTSQGYWERTLLQYVRIMERVQSGRLDGTEYRFYVF